MGAKKPPGRRLKWDRMCAIMVFKKGSKVVPPKGGDAVVTYTDLFGFCLVIIGIISLTLQFINRK